MKVIIRPVRSSGSISSFSSTRSSTRPRGKDTTYLKRVIALGGESVEIHKGKVYVNGRVLHQPFPFMPHDAEEEFEKLTVPKDEYFLLSDNRTNSLDSRYWKKPTLDKSHIYGKAVEIIPQ
jgi:signal peptidase I